MKVTVDDRLLIDKAAGRDSKAAGTAELTAGKPSKIIVEYIHETGPASIHLSRVSSDGKEQILFPVSHP